MTKEQALEELAALRPKERAAYEACEAKQKERDAMLKQWQCEHDKLVDVWSPLYRRIQQLETFLEMT